MKRYIVRIVYHLEGRDESSAPLTKEMAAWFAATMRASHRRVTVTVTPVAC